MKSVNENRERMHLELALAVAEFELTHKVTYCKPQKTKVNRRVKVKEALFIEASAPVNRPATMFDRISERKLCGVWNNW